MERLLKVPAVFCAVLFPFAPAAPQAPPEPTATLKLGSASASPGGSATVPVLVNGSDPVQGISFSIDFDETLLQIESIEPLWQDGSNWINEIHADGSIQYINVRNADDIAGDSGIAEGYVAGGIVFDARFPDLYPPPDEDSAIVAMHFLVKPTAPPGATEIRFIDNAKPFPNNPPIPNLVVINLHSVDGKDLELKTAPLLINARLNILGGGPRFIRGDSNGDSSVDLSDALYSLVYLFLLGPPPPCLDSADANDDGAVDVADAVATLAFLFLDGTHLPEPSGLPGVDPTGDDLPCDRGL